MPGALRYDERPYDETPIHTADLPATPVRDRNIPASAWAEAPAALLALGDDLPGRPVADYKRRIGPWLLWRARPPLGADAPDRGGPAHGPRGRTRPSPFSSRRT